MEIFKNIENYENLYQVSNYGRVYSVKSGKFLKPDKNQNGYLRAKLFKENKIKAYSLHRLVAQAFIPNPLHLPQVNHKDENPSNNRVDNLEWCDSKYNNNYGTRTKKMVSNPNYRASREKCSKAVLQFTREDKFVAEYPSTQEAERQTKISQGNISKCCLGKRHSAGKYLWKFKEEEVA